MPSFTYTALSPTGQQVSGKLQVGTRAEAFRKLEAQSLTPMKVLEEAGAAAVMPLGSLIGSNMGLRMRDFIEIIIANAHVPVIIDAGIGRPSQACDAMEMGADAVMALLEANPALARFVRTKKEVNKDAVLNEPEFFAANPVPGIKIVQGKEFFVIEPYNQQLPEA